MSGDHQARPPSGSAPDALPDQPPASTSADDVAAWRRTQRAALLERRRMLDQDARARIDAGLLAQLDIVLQPRLSPADVISFYWPIKGEPDLRPLMQRLHAAGMRIALPLVETRAAPLVFRLWTPETRLVRGHWNILVPPPDAPVILPKVTLAPLVGWDTAGYRLGYGGGYFDRTLAALSPRPLAIGVGAQSARLESIHPQPHDIPMDAILTESGTYSAGN